jgi:hypothetical protein
LVFALLLVASVTLTAQEPVPVPAPASTPAPVPAASSSAPAAPAEKKLSKEFDIPANRQWTDTGLDLTMGDRVALAGQGEIQYKALAVTPQGMRRSWQDLLRSLPVNAAGVGALVGRIGDSTAEPFLVGAQKEVRVNHPGRLFLGVNVAANDAGTGNFQVTVDVFSGGASPASAAAGQKVNLTAKTLQEIPRRIGDQQGNPGDMVNFVIVGSKEALQSTFQAAGWRLADRTTKQAVVNAVFSSLAKDAYLQMPMSELYLFGRPQDFGYEHAEPIAMVAQRHHLRIWKAPFDLDGQPVWVGAATHDIGFEKDQRNNGVTHKIDPEIDKERDFVRETLNATGNIAVVDYATPPDPVQEAHTATGGTWHSDGRLLVLQLK